MPLSCHLDLQGVIDALPPKKKNLCIAILQCLLYSVMTDPSYWAWIYENALYKL